MTRLPSVEPILSLGKHNSHIFTPVTHTEIHTPKYTQKNIENWRLLNLHDFSTSCEIYSVVSTVNSMAMERLMEMVMVMEMEMEWEMEKVVSVTKLNAGSDI